MKLLREKIKADFILWNWSIDQYIMEAGVYGFLTGYLIKFFYDNWVLFT